MKKGRIHSIESFGTVDGPGIRLVTFMQGCSLRCLYCHNPDTWNINAGNLMTVQEILDFYTSNKAFYKNGGITVTGGEPLLQTDFLIELFTSAKELGIHTCIDTSGTTFNRKDTDYLRKLDLLLSLTDLVILDIKHIDTIEHAKLTSKPNEQILDFALYLDEKRIDLWIRHVLIPHITYVHEHLYALGYFIGDLSNLKSLDVLPYHTIGKVKYKNLGIDYPLEDVAAPDASDAAMAREIIISGMKRRRDENFHG